MKPWEGAMSPSASDRPGQGHRTAQATAGPDPTDIATDASAGGCGCGAGGCGGGDGAAPATSGQALNIDPRLDVRDLPPRQRHAVVLSALEGLAPGGALVLVAPHAPRPLLAEVEQKFAGQFEIEWLQSGPEKWQIRLARRAGAASPAVS
ncbi:MAG TPA: DUF2249 domain-containing protein [Micromonospora sp.]|nr:DUF2249 domain-containing protein [Micromonospora sp.]